MLNLFHLNVVRTVETKNRVPTHSQKTVKYSVSNGRTESGSCVYTSGLKVGVETTLRRLAHARPRHADVVALPYHLRELDHQRLAALGFDASTPSLSQGMEGSGEA